MASSHKAYFEGASGRSDTRRTRHPWGCFRRSYRSTANASTTSVVPCRPLLARYVAFPPAVLPPCDPARSDRPVVGLRHSSLDSRHPVAAAIGLGPVQPCGHPRRRESPGHNARPPPGAMYASCGPQSSFTSPRTLATAVPCYRLIESYGGGSICPTTCGPRTPRFLSS